MFFNFCNFVQELKMHQQKFLNGAKEKNDEITPKLLLFEQRQQDTVTHRTMSILRQTQKVIRYRLPCKAIKRSYERENMEKIQPGPKQQHHDEL